MAHERKADPKMVLKGLTMISELYCDVCPKCREKVIDAFIRNAVNPPPRDIIKKSFERIMEVTHGGC